MNLFIQLLRRSIADVIAGLEALNPHIPDDCANQLSVTLQHQFDRDHATLRQLDHQLECFGERLYQADKEEIQR